MADAEKKPKKYAPGIYVRKHEFAATGGHVYNVSIRVDQFVAWLNEMRADGQDYVRLTMARKREADKYGTHCVYLDEFNRVRNDPAREEQGAAREEPKPASAEEKPDDLPF